MTDPLSDEREPSPWDRAVAAHEKSLVVGARVMVRLNGECSIPFCRLALDNNGIGEIIGIYREPYWPDDRQYLHFYRVNIDPFNPKHRRGDKAAGCIAMFAAIELILLDDAP